MKTILFFIFLAFSQTAFANTTLSEDYPTYEKWLSQQRVPNSNEVLKLTLDEHRPGTEKTAQCKSAYCYSRTSPRIWINYTKSRPWRRNRIIFWTLLGHRFDDTKMNNSHRKRYAKIVNEKFKIYNFRGTSYRISNWWDYSKGYSLAEQFATVYSWCSLNPRLQVSGFNKNGWSTRHNIDFGKKTKRKVCKLIKRV